MTSFAPVWDEVTVTIGPQPVAGVAFARSICSNETKTSSKTVAKRRERPLRVAVSPVGTLVGRTRWAAMPL